jgi:hypothetical protein
MIDEGIVSLRDRDPTLMAAAAETRKRHKLLCSYCRAWVETLFADARPNAPMCLTCWQRLRGNAAPSVVRAGHRRLPGRPGRG